MRFPGVLLLALACAGFAGAQSPRELVEQAAKLREEGQAARAQALAERALAQAEGGADRWAEAEARRLIAVGLTRGTKYQEGRQELDRAFAIFGALGDHVGRGRVLREYGYLEWVAGNRTKEIDFYRKALAEFEAGGEAGEQAVTIARLLGVLTSVEERLKLAEEGLRLAREAKERTGEGLILLRWGDALFSQGKYAEAAEKITSAVAIFQERGRLQEQAAALISLGRVHRAHGMHQQSLDAYLQALALAEKAGDAAQLVGALNAVSVGYARLGNAEAELEYARRALEAARQAGSPRLVRRQLLELGTIHRTRGDFRNAVAVIEEVIAGGGDLDDIPWRHLAYSYHMLGDARALPTADRAVETSRRRLPEFLTEALRIRAVIRMREGLLEESLRDVEEGLELLERQRRGVLPEDALKRGFSEQNQALYALAVEVLAALGRHGQALETAERARARAFADLMAGRNTAVKPRDAEKLAALRALEREAPPSPAPAEAGLPVPVRGAGGPARGPSSSWRGADAELRSFAAAEPYTLKELAAAAARLNSTVLSYWVNRTATYIWAVRPDGSVAGARVEVAREELEKRIAETRTLSGGERRRGEVEREIILRGGEAARVSAAVRKDAWRRLYQWLIEPVRGTLPEAEGSLLTVVPHGPLFQLPFAALMDGRGRYLVEKYRIHYTPSGAALEFTKGKGSRDGQTELLLVADPAGMKTPEGKPLPPLPGARREVKAIAKLAREAKVTVLAGAEADEARVRAALAGKRVVHFATHGVLRPGQPGETFLALAPGASGHDAWLTAGEVYQVDLEADLVVLSACRSAAGAQSADGLIGLTRAFFYAGAPAVLASLWDAADEPSARLAEEFYRRYFQGAGKSAALREAQLRMIAALRSGRVQASTVAGPVALPEHPAFWAGFVLAGEP